MLRHSLFRNLERHHNGFRHRGNEIARIEAFSDAVFGFSISLLIVALEVPQTFHELQHTIYGFLPFVCTAALVFLFWYHQYRYFRRYGLNDTATIWLNAALLIMILFYIYPLKFLFSLLLMYATGINLFPHAIEQGRVVLKPQDLPHLIVLYSAGYMLIWTIFFILYWRSWKLRRMLGLNAYEQLETKKQLWGAGINALIGAVAMGFAALNLSLLSGFTYFLIPVVLVLNHWIFNNALKKIRYQKRHHAPTAHV